MRKRSANLYNLDGSTLVALLVLRHGLPKTHSNIVVVWTSQRHHLNQTTILVVQSSEVLLAFRDKDEELKDQIISKRE